MNSLSLVVGARSCRRDNKGNKRGHGRDVQPNPNPQFPRVRVGVFCGAEAEVIEKEGGNGQETGGGHVTGQIPIPN